MPGAQVKSVPRARIWKVQKDREVFMTPEGPVIAEKGAYVALGVADSYEEAAKLLLPLFKEADDSR